MKIIWCCGYIRWTVCVVHNLISMMLYVCCCCFDFTRYTFIYVCYVHFAHARSYTHTFGLVCTRLGYWVHRYVRHALRWVCCASRLFTTCSHDVTLRCRLRTAHTRARCVYAYAHTECCTPSVVESVFSIGDVLRNWWWYWYYWCLHVMKIDDVDIGSDVCVMLIWWRWWYY